MNIQLENFRSFDNTGLLATNDITVFVGKNSSGKSSLLRFYPLMKQTLANSTREPILWYTPDYVDFGSFNDVVGNKKNEAITLTYDFVLPFELLVESISDSHRDILFSTPLKGSEFFNMYDDTNVSLSIDVIDDFVSRIEIKALEVFIEIFIDIRDNEKEVTHIFVNDINLYNLTKRTDNEKKVRFSQFPKSFLPRFFVTRNNSRKSHLNESNLINREYSTNAILFNSMHFQSKALRILNKYLSSVGEDHLDEEILNEVLFSKILPLNAEEIIKKIRLSKLIRDKTNKKLAKRYGNNEEKAFKENTLQDVADIYIASFLNGYLGAIDTYFLHYFTKIVYIAPLRATAQRYYRLQGIAISEMDSSGANIPMIIANMKPNDLQQFQKWTMDNFGFEVDRTSTEGHVSISINFKNQDSRNIVDLGFGYSQLLPLIVAIWNTLNKQPDMYFDRWSLSKGRGNPFPYTIVIEQPELHLHPAMQSLFIQVCAQIAKNNDKSGNKKINFIIETHSETIINSLSDLISQENLKPENVSVNVVNIDESNVSSVKTLNFDIDGDLEEWPIGFFSPGMELL